MGGVWAFRGPRQAKVNGGHESSLQVSQRVHRAYTAKAYDCHTGFVARAG
jgi:hypothetical protein